VVFVVGVLFSGLLARQVARWEGQRGELDFMARAENELRALRRVLEGTVETFQTLQLFPPALRTEGERGMFSFLDARDFALSVAQPLSRVPGIEAVAWIPVVEAVDWEAYVERVRATDYADFGLRELGGGAATAPRSRYHPIHHLHIYGNHRAGIGEALFADPAYRDLLRGGFAEGGVLAKWVAGSWRPGDSLQMALVQPVYGPPPASPALPNERKPVGYVLSLTDFRAFIETALGDFDDQAVNMLIYEEREDGRRLLYPQREEAWAPTEDGPEGAPDPSRETFAWTASLTLAGQHWWLVYYPAADGFSARGLWAPWQIWVAGILISLLLGSHLWAVGARNAEVARLVVDGTRELRRINGELHSEVGERKRAEDELRKISRAVEQSANMIMITDASGAIEYVNPKFTETYGYAVAEVVGRRPDLLRSTDTRQAHIDKAGATIREGKEWQGEFVNVRKDGKPVRVAATISPIRNEKGAVTHFISVQVDITHQKKLEEQFLQSQKMEVIGRLVGGIAHDFNNILTTILGFGQIFLRKVKEEDWMRPGLDEMVQAAERASHLTRQMLIFARKSDHSAHVTDLHLNSIIENMLKLVRRSLGEDIELLTLLEEDIGAIQGDQTQIEQVILNLGVNARDAMPRGGKLILRTRAVYLDEDYCRGRLELKPGEYVLLSVADTGCGMCREVREHAFEPFFTTKGVGRGTGLGLSTVYGILKQAGGDIEVFSQVGVGTEFKLYFPRSRTSAEPAVQPSPGEPPRGDETILVVEDDDSVRRVTVMVLKELGYRVYEASHGREALDICKRANGQIDLIFVDVVMPQMSGPELVDALRTLELKHKLIYTSGFTEHPAIKHSGRQVNGHAFLEKPFTRAGLGRAVRDVLDQAA